MWIFFSPTETTQIRNNNSRSQRVESDFNVAPEYVFDSFNTHAASIQSLYH